MIAASLVALALAAAASAGPALTLKLSGAQHFNGVDSMVVTATLTNTGDEAARVLNDPRTILSKTETDTFAIQGSNGATPKFTGKFVKYVPSVDRSSTTLQPGESVTVEHAIGDAYDFTHSGEGSYSLETSSLFTLVTDAGLQTVHADTFAHEASLVGSLTKTKSSIEKRISYNACSSTRQSQISAAASAAQSYANAAYAYAANHTSSTTRYVTWFGTYTDSRHSTVVSHYRQLSTHSYSSYEYDCTCTDADTYAYTYADETGVIYLCGAFWQAPTTGTDSKGGTLVHESTHWTAYAGTQDYAYGQSAAKSLAKSNPSHAIMNADSHEYFAENNPAQS